MDTAELAENQLTVGKSDETIALKALARSHLHAGQLEQAKQICLRLIQRNGHDPEVSGMLAEARVLRAKLQTLTATGNSLPASVTPPSQPQTIPAETHGISLDPGLTLQLGEHTYIHDRKIRNPSGALTHLRIGKFCSIATDLVIIGYDHHVEWITTYPFLDDGIRPAWPGTQGIPYPQAPEFGSNRNRGDISIGHDVWIGYNVKLFKGVTIGNGAVIGACSLVNKSVPPYAIVAGTPARPIRRRFSEADIEALQRIQWWDWPAEKINRYMPLLCSANIAELEKRLAQDRDAAARAAS